MRAAVPILLLALSLATRAGAADASAISIRVDDTAAHLAADDVETAIRRELIGAHVRAGELTVTVHANRTATLTFRGGDGHPLERTIALPATMSGALEAISLLAGNLARDEASELVPHALAPPKSSDAKPTPREPPPAPTAPAPAPSPSAARPWSPIGFALFDPLALPRDARERTIALELGLAYGRIGRLGGVALELGYGRVDGDVDGVQLAGIYQRADGDTSGARLAGVGNEAGGRLRGFEAAGVLNWRTGDVYGAQTSAAINRAIDVSGVQGAAAVNVARDLSGVQASAGVNVASGDVFGAQLGLVNVGGHVRGTQIGLVNVAERVDGLPVGLVNVVAQGRTQALAWVSQGAMVNAAVKYLNGPAYSMIVGAYRRDGTVDESFAGFALGARVGSGRPYVEADVLYIYGGPRSLDDGGRHALRYRAHLGFEVTKFLAVFAGGAARQEIETSDRHLQPDFQAGVALF